MQGQALAAAQAALEMCPTATEAAQGAAQEAPMAGARPLEELLHTLLRRGRPWGSAYSGGGGGGRRGRWRGAGGIEGP